MIPRKTKIVCTIGPATKDPDNLLKLIKSGMDVARLNFSHGSHEIHLQTLKDLREASQIAGKEIAILQDLQGPKIRIGGVENGEVFLSDGADFIITNDDIEIGTAEKVGTTYKELITDVKPGSTLLLDDGYIILKVDRIDRSNIYTKVIKGGKLKSNKGIIAPGVEISAPSLSSKDIDDLKFGLEHGVDAVALSFVRSERDVIELRTTMKIFGRQVPIISKIERFEGYSDLADIIEESDGIMVARGDLGIEMPAEDVPILQKDIITKCNQSGKPVITATQMLESMINNPRPTRAEASDVANAVIDGTDCVMLSGETSVGSYPFTTVEYMDKIIRAAEAKFAESKYQHEISLTKQSSLNDAIAKASCVIAGQIKASAIVCLTNSGYTAQNIAKYRPVIPIIAFTQSIDSLRRLSLTWGVVPYQVSCNFKFDDVISQAGEILSNIDYISKGDNIVFVSGLVEDKLHSENMIKIIQA